uniref:Uncharacterized protein n=1 Tax=Octopus bimaculoides TaxID=37653 RepID=A0A0L8HLI0_OCTBM
MYLNDYKLTFFYSNEGRMSLPSCSVSESLFTIPGFRMMQFTTIRGEVRRNI